MKLRSVVFYVSNIEISKRFYLKLGFEINRDDGKYIELITDNKCKSGPFLDLSESNSQQKQPGKQICCIDTKEIDKLFRKYSTISVRISSKLIEKTWGKTFSIKDPDGNTIEFIQQ
ncbi:VOC family protein [Candidatus Dojkabacteria bacterium]|nr:VOC family protein [Candidatus Dojkabacteria bacterium]